MAKIFTPKAKFIFGIIISITIIFLACSVFWLIKEITIRSLQPPPQVTDLLQSTKKAVSFEKLKQMFKAEYSRTEENLKKAIKVSDEYPQDPRPKENKNLWQDYMDIISNNYFSCTALKSNRNPNGKIQGKSLLK